MPTLQAIQTFRDRLAELESALTDRDEAAIVAWWESARALRSGFDRLNGPRPVES